MDDAIDAVLSIDKSVGFTSMDVVRRVKRLLGQRHVGHGGTLDPQASGLLPVCLGYANRLMQFLVDSTKEYHGTILLGVSTDTYDAQGQIVAEHDPSFVTREAAEAALDTLRGTIQQTPPMYSALKHEGRRLYNLARSGVEVERAPREVEIFRLDMAQWTPPQLTLEVECGRGVYIRSLAHDLGQLLGCGAHLVALRRLRTGPFHVDSAISLERFEELCNQGSSESVLYPPDYLVLHLRAVAVSRQEETKLQNGQPVSLSPRTHYAQHLEQCRAYSADGRLIALVQFNRPLRLWQPFKVFRSQAKSPYAEESVLV